MLQKLLAAHKAGQLQFFGQHTHLAERKAFRGLLASASNVQADNHTLKKGLLPIWELPDVGGVSLVLLCFCAEEEGQPSRSSRNGVARWRSSQDGSDEQIFGADKQDRSPGQSD